MKVNESSIALFQDNESSIALSTLLSYRFHKYEQNVYD